MRASKRRPGPPAGRTYALVIGPLVACSFLAGVAAFQQSILQALREVTDALISYQRVTEARQHLEVLVDASREYLRLAQLRRANGVVGYIDVVDAQRSLFESELQLSRFVREQLLAVVQLYKALGGSWGEEAANDVDA